MNGTTNMRTIIITFVIALIPQLVLASEINATLYCTVQSFKTITIGTNTTDSVSVDTHPASKPIRVTYEPQKHGVILETYSATHEPQKSLYGKSYSAGGTQYIGLKDSKEAITYFGLNEEGYHVIVKFIRGISNDGSTSEGWRTDTFSNIHILCIDKNSDKL